MTDPVQLDITFHGEQSFRRVSWRPDDGIFQGDGLAVEWIEAACAGAQRDGGVCVHPWPTLIATPAPARVAAQLAAALTSIATLPPVLQAALEQEVRQRVSPLPDNVVA